MAASGVYPIPSTSAPRVVGLPQQKKILEDVLECIIKLKSEFFENQQPISDDNVTLQRFCAKLEHLVQMGMKEKSSLLGRRKDYWDYFCDTLGSAKGFNDGIKYVKNLRESKTSLGRGRAFIRFCLVHQRLADALQQSLSHEKTSLWFLPSGVLCSPKDSNSLISALYDLNSLHFDLSPRGYDLDSAWPSFANRTTSAGGSWNIPISRRSSVTSMDTVSQISVSMSEACDIDKLQKDLEAAQSAQNDVQEQLGALQKEKEDFSHVVWESQGQVTTLQEQLNHCRREHTTLLEQHRELNVNFVKLKMEKDHVDTLLLQEKGKLKEQESKRVQQLQGEEAVWKREMREEGERRKREVDKLLVDLNAKTNEEEEKGRKLQQFFDSLLGLMSDFEIEQASQEDFQSNINLIQTWMKSLQTQIDKMKPEKLSSENQVAKTQEELEKLKEEMATINRNLEFSTSQISTLESDQLKKCEEIDSLKFHIVSLEKNAVHKEEMESLKNINRELSDKEKDFKELHQIMKENLPGFTQNLLGNKQELERYMKKVFKMEDLVVDLQQQVIKLENSNRMKEEKINEANEKMNKLTTDMEAVLLEKEETIKVVSLELQNTKVKSFRYEKEVDVLRHAGQALNEHLSATEARVELLSEKSKHEESRATEWMAKHEEMKAENELKSEIEKERDGLRCQIENLTLQVQTLSKNVEDSRKTLEDSEKKHEELQAGFRSVQAELEDKKKELNTEKDRVLVLLTNSERKDKSETERSEQMSGLLSQSETVRREKDELLSLFEREKEQWKKSLEEKENEKSTLLSEMESLKKTHRETEEATEALWKSKVEENEGKYFEIFKSLNEIVVQALRQCQILKLDSPEAERDARNGVENGIDEPSPEDLSLLRERVGENLASLCDKVKELIESQVKTNTSLLQNSTSMEEERVQLLGQIDAALEETRSIKAQLEDTSEQLDATSNSLDTLSSEKESLQSKVSAMMEEIAWHESEKDGLRREMSVLKKDCERAVDEGQEKLSEKRDLEVQLEEVEEQLKNVMSEKSKLEKTVEEFYSQTEFSHKVLEESLVDAQSALEAMRAEKMALEEKCSVMEKEKTCAEEKLQSAIELNSTSERPQVSSESMNEEKFHLALEEQKAKYELDMDTLNCEISALRFQLSSEQISNSSYYQADQSAGSKADIEELEETIKQLEGENEELKKWKEEEGSKSDQSNGLQIQILSLEEKVDHYENKMKKMEENLADAISKRDQMSLKLTELQFSSMKKVEEKDKELETLKSDNEGMKKQILKLLKAKDNLWQKTDALVDEKKRKASERWQDNSKATSCGLCKAEFSLFLRKHHCRQCGNIFCWACSDNWLDTAHSSKKARVCKTCFDQHNNPDMSLLATSLIDNDSENENDEKESDGCTNYIHTMEGGRVRIREVSPRTAAAFQANNDDDNVFISTTNETDEGKLSQRTPDLRRSSSRTSPDSVEDNVYTSHAGNGASNDIDSIDDSVYEVITQADIIKTVADYESPKLPAASNQANMASSMMLEADELGTGVVNRHNEVWIKPGKQFAVPIKIGGPGGTILSWEFSSQPKDIVFSINYCVDEDTSPSEAEEIVSPCKCNAHKQMHRGELTAKRPGIYTLVFDNTYSRMTSKKVNYHLEYRKPSQDE